MKFKLKNTNITTNILVKSLFISLLTSIFISTDCFSAEIANVKNNKVLIKFSADENIQTDLSYYAIDTNGKKSALIEITKTKGNQAIGNIIQGKVEKGYKLETQNSVKSREQKVLLDNVVVPLHWGIMGGMANTLMTVPVQNGESIRLVGNSYNFKPYANYKFDDSWATAFGLGIENLVATGASDSCSGKLCEVSINYISLDVLGKFYAYSNFWLGAGAALQVGIQPASNVIQVSDNQVNQKLIIATGYDFQISKKYLLPIQLEYAIYPSSSGVTTDQILYWIGFTWPFTVVSSGSK